jgi:enoyl-CoA hydratase/3-hydroxyacyl-CoA dehydrogenase
MQLPEITLGLLPGIGGMVVPYRRWPHAARTFHSMLREAQKLNAAAARELNILDDVVDDVEDLLPAALRLIDALARAKRKIPDAPVEIEAPAPVSGVVRGAPVSRQVITLIERTVREASKAPTLASALDIGYRAFGECACTAAAREGVTAFGERRAPDFSKTG